MGSWDTAGKAGRWEWLQESKESSANPGAAADAWKKLKVPCESDFLHHPRLECMTNIYLFLKF